MATGSGGQELMARVECVLREEIGPALAMEGGGVELIEVDGGVVRVRLLGTCSGCPSTIWAVLMGIEQELRRHLPEVEYLEAVA